MTTLPSTQPFRIGISRSHAGRFARALSARDGRGCCAKAAGRQAAILTISRAAAYWRDDYDWRAHERELNQLSHFIARIDDANVHYVHETGSGANPTPLLLLHGWPDSFLRYRGVIPHLTGGSTMNDEPRFDVVVPSLPGFAFTGRSRRRARFPRSVIRRSCCIGS